MGVGGNTDADAHMNAEGTPVDFLNVVEANYKNIEQFFFGATTALLRAKHYLNQVTTSSFPENYINVHQGIQCSRADHAGPFMSLFLSMVLCKNKSRLKLFT